MEKFYIVSNERFLKEIRDSKKHSEERRKLINEFFDKKGIAGECYHISGNGIINEPFKDFQKGEIRLFIESCEENNQKFGRELLKPTRLFRDSDVMMWKFRANSKTLKEFQNLCIERNIVINNHPIREGDYFKELHMGGYSASRFEYNGKMYLKMYTSRYDDITPEQEGFDEIKGSEYFSSLEEFEKNKH